MADSQAYECQDPENADCTHDHDECYAPGLNIPMVTIPREHLAALIYGCGTGDDMASCDVANWFDSVYVPAVVTAEQCDQAFTAIMQAHHNPNVIVSDADHIKTCAPCARYVKEHPQ